MKRLFTLVCALVLSFGAAQAQSSTAASQSKVVTSKKVLKAATIENKTAESTAIESKMDRAARLETNGESKPLVMTNEYIDAEIAKLQKVIDENAKTEGFNASGYEQRIRHLESRRPKK